MFMLINVLVLITYSLKDVDIGAHLILFNQGVESPLFYLNLSQIILSDRIYNPP